MKKKHTKHTNYALSSKVGITRLIISQENPEFSDRILRFIE